MILPDRGPSQPSSNYLPGLPQTRSQLAKYWLYRTMLTSLICVVLHVLRLVNLHDASQTFKKIHLTMTRSLLNSLKNYYCRYFSFSK